MEHLINIFKSDTKNLEVTTKTKLFFNGKRLCPFSLNDLLLKSTDGLQIVLQSCCCFTALGAAQTRSLEFLK